MPASHPCSKSSETTIRQAHGKQFSAGDGMDATFQGWEWHLAECDPCGVTGLVPRLQETVYELGFDGPV